MREKRSDHQIDRLGFATASGFCPNPFCSADPGLALSRAIAIIHLVSFLDLHATLLTFRK